MPRSAVYSLRKIDNIGKRIWIIDQCEFLPYAHPPVLSVTNDAEDVCRRLFQRHGDYRFFYKDTMGFWDELVHERGRFLRFAPARFLAAKEGLG